MSQQDNQITLNHQILWWVELLIVTYKIINNKFSWVIIVANVLDYDIAVNEFELQLLYEIPFRTNTLGKDMNLLISYLWVKKYHNSFSTRMDFGIK